MTTTTYYYCLAGGSFLIVYLFCLLACWRKLRRAYEPGGMWEHIEFYQMEAVLIFIPIVNIVWLLILARNEQWYEQQKK